MLNRSILRLKSKYYWPRAFNKIYFCAICYMQNTQCNFIGLRLSGSILWLTCYLQHTTAMYRQIVTPALRMEGKTEDCSLFACSLVRETLLVCPLARGILFVHLLAHWSSFPLAPRRLVGYWSRQLKKNERIRSTWCKFIGYRANGSILPQVKSR